MPIVIESSISLSTLGFGWGLFTRPEMDGLRQDIKEMREDLKIVRLDMQEMKKEVRQGLRKVEREIRDEIKRAVEDMWEEHYQVNAGGNPTLESL